MKLKYSRSIPAAIGIVAFLIVFIVGNEQAFGNPAGWLLIMCASLFLGMERLPTRHALWGFIGGSLYGILLGQFFTLFKPVFIVAIITLISSKMAGKLPVIFNDYALTFLAVYAIGGVARPAYVWQDLLVFAFSVLVLFLLCSVVEKKALATMTKPEEPTPLTVEEKEKPYAKYCTMPIHEPDPALLKQSRKYLAEKDAMAITQRAALLKADAPYANTGYRVMDDGSGYVAVRQFLPGVTTDMMGWWSLWHPRENMRYQLWFPAGHKSIKDVTPDNMEVSTRMSPDIAGCEICGQQLHMIEDTGMGYENVSIEFLTPEQMGFDIDALNQSEIVWMTGGNGHNWGLSDDAPKIPAVVLHVAYEGDGGLWIQSHFWMGWQFENGKPRLMLPPTSTIPLFGPKALINHCVREFANLGHILPSLYQEEAID